MQNDHPHSLYRILGLDPAASPDDVKQAYRRLAKVWHPDRFPHDAQLQQRALKKFQDINQAYTTLQALHRRARADAPGAQPRAPSPPPRSTPPRRRRAVVWSWRMPTWLVVLLVFMTLRLVADSLALSPPSRLVELETAWHRTRPTPTRMLPRPTPLAVSTVRPPATAAPARARTPDFFTVGSSKDEVLAIQGRPTVTSQRVWEYGESRVYFHQDRVTRWEIWPRDPLRARLLPTMPTVITQDFFTVGSTKDEVLVVQGSPTRFTERIWEYTYSRVYFDGNRVTHWDEWPSAPLKAR